MLKLTLFARFSHGTGRERGKLFGEMNVMSELDDRVM